VSRRNRKTASQKVESPTFGRWWRIGSCLTVVGAIGAWCYTAPDRTARQAASLVATDPARADALAEAAIADGTSEISGIHHLERGYHRPLQQFGELGLPITLVN